MYERIKQDAETGGVIVEKQTVTISLERYEELVKKEERLDLLTADYEIEFYLSRKEAK